MLTCKPKKIAVVGAGIAGAACARTLTSAGHSVHVFDKSRGPGGRLATRRFEWVDPQGQAWTTRLDHGAVGITARSQAFQAFVDQALHAGWLAEWAPTLSADSLPLEDGGRLYVPAPDMPALCRRLLDGTAATWVFAVDGLHRGPLGWQVQAGGERHSTQFDTVVLALPPAQAAPLISHHRSDWGSACVCRRDATVLDAGRHRGCSRGCPATCAGLGRGPAANRSAGLGAAQ